MQEDGLLPPLDSHVHRLARRRQTFAGRYVRRAESSSRSVRRRASVSRSQRETGGARAGAKGGVGGVGLGKEREEEEEEAAYAEPEGAGGSPCRNVNAPQRQAAAQAGAMDPKRLYSGRTAGLHARGSGEGKPRELYGGLLR